MILLMLICLGLFLGVLAASSFIRHKQAVPVSVILVFLGAGALIGLVGFLFTRFSAGRVEFLYPWAFILLLFPIGVF